MAVEAEPSAGTEFGESIENAKKSLSLCLSNKFTYAENFLKDVDGKCMYHAISKATISYLQAIFTYEQQLIEVAYGKVKSASHLCDSFRKKHTLGEMVSNWVGKTNFDEFSEMELHAELCYAECLLERAMLTFIQDENLINFIKGGLKIRSAYSIYRNCMHALQQQPKHLVTSKNKIDFESGVYMGMGSFNVLLSLLPPRVLRLLEWVGFSGHKRNGLNWLDKGFQIGGLRSPLCTITLLGYQVVVAPLLGIHDTDVNYVKRILEIELAKFPDSSIFLYFSGRLRQTQGLIEEALYEYKKAISTNIDWHEVHHICYWEMMWCYSFLGEWELAAQYGEMLSTESKWSKCSYIYMHASFLIMHQFELRHSGDPEKMKEAENMSERIDSLLNKVKKHKQRIAGKSIPFEKFAITRVDKYHSTGSLIIPGLEIIHVWNGFTMFSKHKKTLEHFLRLSTLALQELKETEGYPKEHHDNVCLCLLLKGICLRHLKRTEEAEETLNSVASSSLSSHSCKMDSYLPPYAAAEIGAMYAENGEQDKALKQYEHTLKHYAKYGLESRLHFRVHSGIEAIKESKGNQLKNGVINPEEELSDDEFFDVVEILEDEEFCDVATAECEFTSDTEIMQNGVQMHKSDTEIHKNGHRDTKVTPNGFKMNLVSNKDEESNMKLDHNEESISTSSSLSNVSMNPKESRNNGDSLCSEHSEPSSTSQQPSGTKTKKSRGSPRSWFTKKSPTNVGSSDESSTRSSPTLSEASSNVSPSHTYNRQPSQLFASRETGV